MNGTPKYVVSNTLERVDWQNRTLVARDVLGEIKALKERPGRNIGAPEREGFFTPQLKD